MRRVRLYYPGTSWLHTMHPSAKLLFWILLTIVVASLPWRLNIVLAVAIITALASTRVPFSHYRLFILVAIPVSILSPLLNVAFPDPTMHQIAFWLPSIGLEPGKGLVVGATNVPVYYEALRQGIDRDFLFGSTMILTIIVLVTTELHNLADAPTYLGVPHVVGFTLAATLRYIPEVANFILTLYDVQESRGVDFWTRNPAKNFIRRTNILVPVLIFQLSRASRMSNAMESRGFQIRRSPTLYALPTMARSERFFLFAVGAATLVIGLLRIYTVIVPGNYPFEFGTF